MTTNFREEVSLSVMRALWGEIYPETRAVACNIDGNKSFVIEFFVDGPISGDLRESASCVETEVIADFPPDFNVRHVVKRIDAPERIPLEGVVLVYLRKEVGAASIRWR